MAKQRLSGKLQPWADLLSLIVEAFTSTSVVVLSATLKRSTNLQTMVSQLRFTSGGSRPGDERMHQA